MAKRKSIAQKKKRYTRKRSKTKAEDPKGSVDAPTQSFTLTEVEGHVESTWKPRSH